MDFTTSKYSQLSMHQPKACYYCRPLKSYVLVYKDDNWMEWSGTERGEVRE